MMEAHLDFLRVIEVYQARRLKSGPHNLKVDILLCDETAEKYLHMTSIEEEKRAFKALVEMKPKLCVDRRDTELSQIDTFMKVAPPTNTRLGGKKDLQAEAEKELKLWNEKAKQSIIIVDQREFSSTTPMQLHDKGFWIVPMQLNVGDYILTDEICVERKCVSTGDLFDSFKTGRLLQQVKNM